MRNKYFLFNTLLICFIVFFLLSSCGDSAKSDNIEIKNVTLKSGDILFESLADCGLSPIYCAEIVEHLRKIFLPKNCQPGDRYEVKIDSSNNWISFCYYPKKLEYYSVEKIKDGKIEVLKNKKEIKKVISSAKGQIETTLWEAMFNKGINPDVINSFTELFAWQVDFLVETRRGDSFKVICEKLITDDGFVVNEQILAAQYVNSGNYLTSIFYKDSKDSIGYYSPDGTSLRRAFLRAPLQYSRISSFFSKKRFHPILRYYRPHLGIDYAAPIGTPVSAVADGRVIYKGWNGGYGRLIKLRHSNGYVTYYGHLSRYHRSISVGKRVNQGQLIGYVGSSGLSTGPHLDFRISKNNKFINFLRLKIPPSRKLSDNELANFKKVARDSLTMLANIYSDSISENIIKTAKK